jgi:hypothetical protein
LLLYAPPGLTFTNSTFCPHSVFMRFVWISEQTAIISLYSINWLVFIAETECVYCAVRAGSLYICIIQVNVSLREGVRLEEVLPSPAEVLQNWNSIAGVRGSHFSHFCQQLKSSNCWVWLLCFPKLEFYFSVPVVLNFLHFLRHYTVKHRDTCRCITVSTLGIISGVSLWTGVQIFPTSSQSLVCICSRNSHAACSQYFVGHFVVKSLHTFGRLAVNILDSLSGFSLEICRYIFERSTVNYVEILRALHDAGHEYTVGRFAVNCLCVIFRVSLESIIDIFSGVSRFVFSTFCRVSHCDFSRRFVARRTVGSFGISLDVTQWIISTFVCLFAVGILPVAWSVWRWIFWAYCRKAHWNFSTLFRAFHRQMSRHFASRFAVNDLEVMCDPLPVIRWKLWIIGRRTRGKFSRILSGASREYSR